MVKVFKRFKCVVLVMLLIVGVGMIFTGCDSKKTDKVEVTFWEEDDTTSVDKAWDEIIKDFERKNENKYTIRNRS